MLVVFNLACEIRRYVFNMYNASHQVSTLEGFTAGETVDSGQAWNLEQAEPWKIPTSGKKETVKTSPHALSKLFRVKITFRFALHQGLLQRR